ncbi:phospholipase/carboxylesterase [Fischerella sp. NIES-4106]|nr:phospholipase/carboxylesterase [Fischerella sp. NIES-4106]
MFTNILFWLGILTVLTYCAVCILIFLRQTRFIFFPSSTIETTPRFLNLPYEEIWLPIQIQLHQLEYIHGWWLRANQSNGKVLLYLHGNGINIGANITNASRFYQLGFSVLLIDYRGYGNSRGRFPNEKRVYEDAVIAWNYLVHQRRITPSQIFIYGHSLGGA